MSQVHFIIPGALNQRTGGYLYDQHMVEALARAEIPVTVVGLEGTFPIADDQARSAMTAALWAADPDDVLIMDGLALGGLGDVVVACLSELNKRAPRCIALVHHPLADERGLSKGLAEHLYDQERLALSVMDQVLVTSSFTAKRLMDQGYVNSPPTVVTPGVEPAPLAISAANEGSLLAARTQRFVCVASMTPRKGHEVLLSALADIQALDWVCQWVGGTRDGEHALSLQQQIQALGLSDRIECLGELDEKALDAVYHQADLAVLASWYEGYGMVVTEAIARGLPMITTDGGALADTLPPNAGVLVPAGDAQALARALSQWCQDPQFRGQLSQGASAAREDLNSWAVVGQRFIDVLGLSTLRPSASSQQQRL